MIVYRTLCVRGIIDQEKLENELLVAWNGEDVYQCDSIVKEALKTYFASYKDPKSRGGHFIKRSEDIKSYSHSKAIDTH